MWLQSPWFKFDCGPLLHVIPISLKAETNPQFLWVMSLFSRVSHQLLYHWCRTMTDVNTSKHETWRYLLVLVLSGLISAFLLRSPRDVDRYSSFTPVDTAGILAGVLSHSSQAGKPSQCCTQALHISGKKKKKNKTRCFIKTFNSPSLELLFALLSFHLPSPVRQHFKNGEKQETFI